MQVERWNAQLSLLTGMAAAELMLYAEIGVLRTLPSPDQRSVARLRRTAQGLRVAWPARTPPEEFIRRLDTRVPAHAALVATAAGLLQGAGYTAFDGGVPEHATHAGVASEYAHATAPLRRLVDRYVGEVCVAICADRPVPEWVRTALPKLPARMEQSAQRAHQFESGVLSIFEAAALANWGERELDAVVVDVDDDGSGGRLQAAEPPVMARFDGAAKLGARVRARVVEADMARRAVRLAVSS
jgi:exoribonuclease R